MSYQKEKLEAKFKEEYQKLNPQQRLAVDAIEGPVMVIAGPGTGKTQILASRIGKILLDTDARPENILCLTYTEAGVVAMRKRLLQFIGPDSYKVTISTFHGFCNDVIQENLNLFEKTALDPISDLEKAAMFKELIDSLPKNNPLKRYRGDVYFEATRLQKLFSDMKREGWTSDFMLGRIDEYITSLPTRDEFIYKRKYKEFNPGDPKQHLIDEAKEKMETLKAAIREFDRFQELMRKKNRYDFDDMINWVIRAFESNKNLLANYQEQYQYILVDEYQDTSGTQNRIVQLLINYWDKPNVFVVGDDDQSIYRFQGANVENMLDFAQQYREALSTVVLTNNYRSTQPILNVSKNLIERNEERLVKKIDGLSKDLLSANEKIRELTHTPLLFEYQKMRDEMIGITLQVEKLVKSGVNPGRIGIIYRENKYGDELSAFLRQRGIPVYTKRSQNLFEIPLARKILNMLRYLAAEHDTPYGGDELLFEILHYHWFGIAPIEIAKLSIEVSEKKFSEDPTSIRRLLTEKAAQPGRDLFTPGLPESLKNASAVLEKLIGAVSNITLQQLFEELIRSTGLLQQVVESPNKHEDLEVISALFDFIQEENRREPRMTLLDLVQLTDLMEKEELRLPLPRVSGSDKGVNLMTAHGSKGLEFEHVFVVGVNAKSWDKKKGANRDFSLPDTLFTSQPKQSDEEEQRRLFYVALTRAEQHLYISYSLFKNDGKELEPSRFIAEMLEGHPLPVEKVVIDEAVEDEFALLRFSDAPPPEWEQADEDVVGRMLDKFTMNVTALNNYLNCPLEFYFRNLIRIPSPKNENTEFGSAVHYALEQLFRKMQDVGKDSFPPVHAFVADFDWYMHRHRESFTQEQFDRRIEYGHQILPAYYEKYNGHWNKIVAIERNIRNVVVKGVPLKGKLDKLEFDGKSVNVVDYKTGNPDNAKDKLQPPNDKSPNGGDYWRQAVFYKILVDHYESKDWKVVSTEFDFIEPDKKKQYRREKLVITPADITTVTQQIVETWEKIQNRDFYKGCGKEDCHWCGFVREVS